MTGRKSVRAHNACSTTLLSPDNSTALDGQSSTPLRNTRRQLLHQAGALALLGAAGAGSTLVNTVFAAESALTTEKGGASDRVDESRINPGPRRLRLVNVHTQEKISVVYWKDGEYQQDSLNKINFLMRDFRANEVMYMDTAVVDYLFDVYSQTESDEHIQILSGYRSPKTNEMLRKRSGGVAKNSLHIVGKAIDFRIPGMATRELQRRALSMQRGGIGFYKRSDFVHIDSGPFRHWE